MGNVAVTSQFPTAGGTPNLGWVKALADKPLDFGARLLIGQRAHY
jgi:hypothetical protein